MKRIAVIDYDVEDVDRSTIHMYSEQMDFQGADDAPLKSCMNNAKEDARQHLLHSNTAAPCVRKK